MAVIIGSARIDENGNIHGGKPGDQTGREVSTQAWYQHRKGWVVACGEGALKLIEVLPQGKKPMRGSDYLNGCRNSLAGGKMLAGK